MGSVSIQVWNKVHYLYLIQSFSLQCWYSNPGLPHAKHAHRQPYRCPSSALCFSHNVAFYLISEHLSCYVGQTELARPTLEQDKNF